jgi:hypothetical protein
MKFVCLGYIEEKAWEERRSRARGVPPPCGTRRAR